MFIVSATSNFIPNCITHIPAEDLLFAGAGRPPLILEDYRPTGNPS